MTVSKAGSNIYEQTTPTRSAIFSTCGRYRYLLTRRLREVEKREHDRVATFIMLNPSTADATHNDPTLRKCMGFARQWQCDTLQVLNLFAVRATRPQDMKRIADPVGPENQHWFAHALTRTTNTHLVICAWGMHGVFMGQDRIILGWLADQDIASYALGFTQGGYPRHPLYVAYSVGLLGIYLNPTPEHTLVSEKA